MRSVARALGGRQHFHRDHVRFIGKVGEMKEIIGMPTGVDTFVVHLRFPHLLEKAGNFAEVLDDK